MLDVGFPKRPPPPADDTRHVLAALHTIQINGLRDLT